MASVSRLPFSLLVLLLTVNGVYSAVDAGRSSSGTGPAYQTCPTGYYCPFDKLCHYPRSNRTILVAIVAQEIKIALI